MNKIAPRPELLAQANAAWKRFAAIHDRMSWQESDTFEAEDVRRMWSMLTPQEADIYINLCSRDDRDDLSAAVACQLVVFDFKLVLGTIGCCNNTSSGTGTRAYRD